MNSIRINKEEDSKPIKINSIGYSGPSIVTNNNTNTNSTNTNANAFKQQNNNGTGSGVFEVQYDKSDADLFSKLTTNDPLTEFNDKKEPVTHDFNLEESDTESNTYVYQSGNDNNTRYGNDNEYSDEHGIHGIHGIEEEPFFQEKEPERIYKLNPKEIKFKKAELLYKLNKINMDGRYSDTILTMNSDLYAIENEYIRIERLIGMETGSETVKSGFLFFTTIMEAVLTKQKLYKLNVKNISYKFLMDSQTPEYEKVFIDIYDKYFSSFDDMDPLLALALLVVKSTATYHFSHSEDDGYIDDPDDLESVYTESNVHEEEAEIEEAETIVPDRKVRQTSPSGSGSGSSRPKRK